MGVTKTEKISATRSHMFGISTGGLVVVTGDMHSPHDCSNSCCGHGSIWDKNNDWPLPESWKKPEGLKLPEGVELQAKDGRYIVHIKDALSIGSLFPEIVRDAYPNAGGVFWGENGHCKRNHTGSDHVQEIPIHPNAVHIIKGTTPELHQYGAGNVNGFNLAEYLHKKGAKAVLLTGWATNFCVGETGREILLTNLAKDLSLVIVTAQDCVGGVCIPGYIDFDDKNPGHVLACYLDKEALDVTKERMGLKELNIDDLDPIKLKEQVIVVGKSNNELTMRIEDICRGNKKHNMR